MRIEYLISIYFVFLSLLIIVLIGKLSDSILKSSKGLSRITIQGFLKGYIKQGQKPKIFFVHFLKYPLFLSTALITLQVQLIGLISPLSGGAMSISMILYIVLKALYANDLGSENEKYFNFISTLDDFFFDLLLIIMVFISEEGSHSYVQLGVSAFFIGNVFLKISNAQMIKSRENRLGSRKEVIFDQVVFELGEYIYNVSLLFFVVSKFIMQDSGLENNQIFFWIGYHLRIIVYIALITVIIKSMEWLLQWPIRKRILDRQVLRVKYILAPIFLLTLIVQMEKLGG